MNIPDYDEIIRSALHEAKKEIQYLLWKLEQHGEKKPYTTVSTLDLLEGAVKLRRLQRRFK